MMIGGKPEGYFEWFRKDGSKMRSGYFNKGKQVGEWTTFDKTGRIVKVTRMQYIERYLILVKGEKFCR